MTTQNEAQSEAIRSEEPFWKRWEKYGNGKCVFLYRRPEGKQIEDVYLVQRSHACVLSVYGNGSRDYRACDCDGLTVYGGDVANDMPEFKWAADAMAHARAKGLLTPAPLTPLEQSEQRVKELTALLVEAADALEGSCPRGTIPPVYQEEVAKKIRAALSGTEGAQK